MQLEYYEQAYTLDPLTILLMEEDEDGLEYQVRSSCCR